MAITIVNKSVGAISYKIFGAGSGTGSGGSGTGGSGIGSGVVGSGVIPSGGTASGIQVSGHPSYSVVFGWPTFPSYTVTSAGVINITTTSKP